MINTKPRLAFMTRLSMYAAALVMAANVCSCTMNALDEGELVPEQLAGSHSSKESLINAEVLNDPALMEIHLPEEYSGLVEKLPLAQITDGEGVYSDYVTGAIAVDIKGVDLSDVRQIVFQANMSITGDFIVAEKQGNC